LANSYQVDLKGEVYTVVDAAQTVYQAVLTGSVTDEIFGALDAPAFTVQLTRSDLGIKAFRNGSYAISGYPGQSFPQLATKSYMVSYTLTVPGFRDCAVSAVIGPGGSLPFTVTAVMRRLPIRIRGQVVNYASRTPIAAALILSIDDPSTPPSVHVTALRSPLAFAHASGVSVQPVAIAVSETSKLAGAVRGGDAILNLTGRAGLSPGSIVRLTSDAGVRMEYGVVDSLGSGAPSDPGTVLLRSSIYRSYTVAATTVEFVEASAVGAAASLSSEADAGDGLLLATQLFTQTVAIESGSSQAEFHEVGALSDSDGYYGFDGIGRTQEIFLQASQLALQQTAGWFVQYDEPVNSVDFRF
jgi:hypothetical protein